jgi:chromosome segregation ATPase
MAVGVPEADVFAAADRVLARGERPTVERVRVELGRGSPARVGQLLETWWDVLAKRLAGETRLPELPTRAATAFTELWRVAMEEARAIAQAETADERASVQAERATFEVERDAWEHRLASAEQARAEADAERHKAVGRLDDSQRLVAQLERQAADAAERLKSLELQVQTLETDRRDLHTRLTAQEAAAAQERESAAVHLRNVEDRSHAEVDRARQEAKTMRVDLERAEHAHQQALREGQHRESELRERLGHQERSAGEHAARCKALEEQLGRLDGLGKALRTAQEAIRAGLDREAQLRQTLDAERRHKRTSGGGTETKIPRKKGSSKTKRPEAP